MTKDEALKMAIEAMIFHTEQTRPLKVTAVAIQACIKALEPTVAELNDEYLRDTHVEGLSTNSKANEIIKTQHLYNLVEILNDPMKAYPHNFSTPAKGNALLLGLCQEAADEIEHLKAETQEPSKEEILGKVFDAVYAQYHPKAETQQPTQEPVAWMNDIDQYVRDNGKILLAPPILPKPPKQWNGLTAEEIASIPLNERTVQTVENLLRSKNT